MSTLINWRIMSSVGILVVAIVSLFYLSFFGAVATILAGCSFVCFIWSQHQFSAALAGLAVLIGLTAAIYDNWTTGMPHEIAILTLKFASDPVANNLTLDDQEIAYNVIAACSIQIYKKLQTLTKDAIAAVYEPARWSWISWAFKSVNEPERCFSEADRLAELSPSYKAELRTLKQ